MTGQKKQVHTIPREPLAMVALLCGVAGLLVSFSSTKVGIYTAVGAGAVGGLLLFLMKARLDNEVLRETGGMIRVGYAEGFWLVLILYLAAAGLNALRYRGGEDQ